MRKIIASVLLIFAVVSLIAFAFTFNQADQEDKRLRNDLQYRSTLVAESLRETVEPNFINKSDKYLQTVVEKFADKQRSAGIAIVDNKNTIVAVSSSLPKDITNSEQIVSDVMDSDKANGVIVSYKDKKFYIFAIPLHDKNSVVGALMIIQNAGYIDARLSEIWRTSLIRVASTVLTVMLAVFIIVRWIIYEPILNLVESLQSARLTGKSNPAKRMPSFPFFRPLTAELTNIQKSLIDARHRASEEARLRLKKLDTPWTEERLKEFLKDALKGRKIYVVSNREPYIHTMKNGKVSFYFPASGMATAIEPIMQACGGTWIAHGSGDADKQVVDEQDRVLVPPDEPKYTLRRVWLTKQEVKGYYNGFANEGLWPLCHMVHTRPHFRKEDWEQYQNVNGKFTKAILKEIDGQHKPIIFVQDYHFALLPRMIKQSRPDAVIGLFWHIPWPNPESFSICPFRKSLLDGMLGADLLGFHTQLHCNNFIDTIGKELESLIDLERFTVTRSGHTTYIKPFPISIAHYDSRRYRQHEKESGASDAAEKTFTDLGIRAKYIGLGVDRLDYTKGILERFAAVEQFLTKYPSYKKQFVFIQISPRSRSDIEQYRAYGEDVVAEAKRINDTFRQNDWTPIRLLTQRFSHRELDVFYKHANVCLVTSLHDGMNLVAKEYIAARDDEQGVLVLSKFAGASRELKDAFIINPYNSEDVADAMQQGLTMMKAEQIRRMRKMREAITQHNVYHWSAEILKTMIDLG